MADVHALSRLRATARRDGTGFRHTVEIRDHHLTVDEPVSVGGGDAGPDPQGLLAASLASCAAITLEMYAQRKGWDLSAVEVSVEYAPPERGCITKFELVLRIPDDLAPDRAERLRVIASQCPVHRALEGDVMFQERIERVHLAA
jgi:putative redox protein